MFEAAYYISNLAIKFNFVSSEIISFPFHNRTFWFLQDCHVLNPCDDHLRVPIHSNFSSDIGLSASDNLG